MFCRITNMKSSWQLVIFLLLATSYLCRAQIRHTYPSDLDDTTNDDNDFAEFDDDEFEHATLQQTRGGKSHEKQQQQHARQPPEIPGKRVGGDQQQQKQENIVLQQQQQESVNKPKSSEKPITASKNIIVDDVNDDEAVTVEDFDADEFESDLPNSHHPPAAGAPAAKDSKPKANTDAGKSPSASSSTPAGSGGGLKIAEVPISLQRRWINYTSEGLMLALVVIYVTMYITGRVVNQRLATTWLEYNRDLLEQEFAFVGLPSEKLDESSTAAADQQETKTSTEILHKEYDHIYTVWCTGRAGMEGMIVQLELLRRQDILASIIKLVRGNSDRITLKALLQDSSSSTTISSATTTTSTSSSSTNSPMDNFVFALARKQLAVTLVKDMADLAYFCPERRPGDRFGIPDSFSVMSELGEVSSAILDRDFVRLLNEHQHSIELLHVSDQYIRTRADEEAALNAGTAPNTKKVVIFTVRLPAGKTSQDAMRDLVPVMQFFFRLLDKLARFHLSREGKAKSDKNRAALQQRYLKATHTQRSEAAQQRRDDKRKAEKDKAMNDSDPEKQRKYEEREYKRDLKKRGPKIKQLKVKSM